MKSKAIAILLMSLVFWSFNSTNDEGDILGTWRIGSTSYEGSTTMCNVCPQIEFKANQKAILTKPSKDTEEYSWSISGETLKLENQLKVSEKPYFTQTEYSFKFEKEPMYLRLELTNERGTTYSLGKIETQVEKH